MNISTPPSNKKEPVNTPQTGKPTGSDKYNCANQFPNASPDNSITTLFFFSASALNFAAPPNGRST